MPALPPRADLDQLRRLAKDRLRAARAADPRARLAAAQLEVARDHGLPSWPALVLEVARRRVLDLRDPERLAQFLREHPEAATAEIRGWLDHPAGASPLGYLAMARYDTAARRWRDVSGTAAAAHLLLASGSPLDPRRHGGDRRAGAGQDARRGAAPGGRGRGDRGGLGEGRSERRAVPGLEGMELTKVIYKPGKILNLIVK